MTPLRKVEKVRSAYGQRKVSGGRAPGGNVECQFAPAVVPRRQLDVVFRTLVVRVVLGCQRDEHLVLTDRCALGGWVVNEGQCVAPVFVGMADRSRSGGRARRSVRVELN